MSNDRTQLATSPLACEIPGTYTIAGIADGMIAFGLATLVVQPMWRPLASLSRSATVFCNIDGGILIWIERHAEYSAPSWMLKVAASKRLGEPVVRVMAHETR